MEALDQDRQPTQGILKIKTLRGGYAKSLGLQPGDKIIGLDGDEFFGTIADINMIFATDEDEENRDQVEAVLTLSREQRIFNVIVNQPLSVKCDTVNAEELTDLKQKDEFLNVAKMENLSQYMIFHDVKKNAELVLRSKSLLAMVIPPFWFLNQRVWEAAIASLLGLLATFAVHWILSVIYFVILCLYVGREHMNLAISFMNYRRFLYFQTIAAETELQAQRVAISLDNELYFRKPVHGLEQIKPRKRRKTPSKA